MNAPKEITYHKIAHTLEVAWDDDRYQIPAELLRVFSPSAEVRGHSAEQRKLQTGKKHIGISDIQAVGNYAIRIVFDDGHDTGIYSWEFLNDLGAKQDDYWQEYLTELKQANGSRLPNIPVGQWTPTPSPGKQPGK